MIYGLFITKNKNIILPILWIFLDIYIYIYIEFSVKNEQTVKFLWKFSKLLSDFSIKFHVKPKNKHIILKKINKQTIVKILTNAKKMGGEPVLRSYVVFFFLVDGKLCRSLVCFGPLHSFCEKHIIVMVHTKMTVQWQMTKQCGREVSNGNVTMSVSFD